MTVWTKDGKDILVKNLVLIHKGAYRKPKVPLPSLLLSESNIFHQSRLSSTSTNDKVVVFDLDETIGCFNALVAIIQHLQSFNVHCDRALLFRLLDLFPEFFRLGIFRILDFLVNKKREKKCKIFLYTNNKFSPELPADIVAYIHKKLGYELFDDIICAFKVDGVVIDTRRTTHTKSHSDFIKCSVLPVNTEICFVDDVCHEEMKHPKIYYLQPYGYRTTLSTDVIVERVMNEIMRVYTVNRSRFSSSLYNYLLEMCGNYFEEDESVHQKVSAKLMYHIREFFLLNYMPNIKRVRTVKSKQTTFRSTKRSSIM